MLEKANKRNIGSYEASRANLDNYSHILEVDDKQKKLTEKWILPHVETITDDLCKIRANVDKRLKKDIKHSKSYPVGMCQEIRNEVYKEMLGASGMNKDLKGLQMVRNFIREGGILKAFWGIDQEKYFQNAIQVGTSILDVANDTVDPRKPKIVFYPDMETAPIKRINSVEAMAEIMERYWGYEIYPNIYFPNLAPFFPIICIKKLIHPKTKKEVRFLKLAREPFDFFHMRNLFINTVVKKEGEETFAESNNFSRDFIFNSKYSGKKLPEGVESALHKKFSTNNPSYMNYYSADIDEVLDQFNTYNIPINKGLLDKDAFLENLQSYKKIAGLVKSIEEKIWIILPI
jgi:hypothetical protein